MSQWMIAKVISFLSATEYQCHSQLLHTFFVASVSRSLIGWHVRRGDSSGRIRSHHLQVCTKPHPNALFESKKRTAEARVGTHLYVSRKLEALWVLCWLDDLFKRGLYVKLYRRYTRLTEMRCDIIALCKSLDFPYSIIYREKRDYPPPPSDRDSNKVSTIFLRIRVVSLRPVVYFYQLSVLRPVVYSLLC